jgi:PHS family inorganic phosphate transporter-like MFS transporter
MFRYWFTVLLVEKMGRIKIQLLGFAMLTILFITLSIAYSSIITRPIVFLLIYGFAQFFFNFGPNSTTVCNRFPSSNFYSFIVVYHSE